MSAGSINDGGPAFAGTQRITRAGYATNEFEPVNGMSLRDYFAAKAMQSLVHGLLQAAAKEPQEAIDRALVAIAPAAYRIADDMIRERMA